MIEYKIEFVEIGPKTGKPLFNVVRVKDGISKVISHFEHAESARKLVERIIEGECVYVVKQYTEKFHV